MHTATPSGRGLDAHGCSIPLEGDWMRTAAQFLWRGLDAHGCPIPLKGTGCTWLPNSSGRGLDRCARLPNSSGRGLDVHGCPILLEGDWMRTAAQFLWKGTGSMRTAAQFLWKGTGCAIVTYLVSQGTCCLHARGCFSRWHSGRSLYAHTHM